MRGRSLHNHKSQYEFLFTSSGVCWGFVNILFQWHKLDINIRYLYSYRDQSHLNALNPHWMTKPMDLGTQWHDLLSHLCARSTLYLRLWSQLILL